MRPGNWPYAVSSLSARSRKLLTLVLYGPLYVGTNRLKGFLQLNVVCGRLPLALTLLLW